MSSAAGLPRRGLILLAAAALSVSPATAWAFSCKKSDAYAYVSLNWPTRTLPYGVRAPGAQKTNPAVVARAVQLGFDAWTRPECTDLQFISEGQVDAANKAISQVIFVDQRWRSASTVLALTTTSYGLQDGIIRSAQIEVNEQDFVFGDIVTDGCPVSPATYDLASVITHEVGHLIGLDHVPRVPGQPDPTMVLDTGPCETDKRSLEEDDIDGLCTLYPRGLPSGHCFTLPPSPGVSYVSNTPFGCACLAPRPAGAALLPALALGLLAARAANKRRRTASS